MDIENKIKQTLNTEICKKISGKGGGGCINSGDCYEIDNNELIFVKICTEPNAAEIISGEYNSLKAIQETNQIHVPDALGIVREPERVALLTNYIEMRPANELQGQLGDHLGKLHLHNQQLSDQQIYNDGYISSSRNAKDLHPVEEFGFHCVTNCGAIAQNNDWEKDWISFFARNRLQHQVKMVEENYNDRQIGELWSELQLKIPKYFKHFTDNAIEIKPSLLHGDLW